MKKTALELIAGLNKKHDLWTKAVNEKRIECKNSLKIMEGKLEALNVGIGVQLAEGNNEKAKELKKERDQLKGDIDSLKDDLALLQNASGHQNFIPELDSIWKAGLQEYCNTTDYYAKKCKEYDDLKEELAELTRRVSFVRGEMTTLSFDVGSFDPIIKFSDTLTRIFENNESKRIKLEKELYCRFQGQKPETLSENWKLSTYAPTNMALSHLLHDVFGRIAADEITDKSPKWN